MADSDYWRTANVAARHYQASYFRDNYRKVERLEKYRVDVISTILSKSAFRPLLSLQRLSYMKVEEYQISGQV